MKPEPHCIIDRARPCRGCIAASPAECPYPYLLADATDAGPVVAGLLREGDGAAA